VLSESDRAEEHALQVIAQHTQPGGAPTSRCVSRTPRADLGIVAARRGDLHGAVSYGESAFEFDRMSVTDDLLVRTGELDRTIQQRYRGERLAREFHEHHLNAARLIDSGSSTTRYE
jgi:hypothetical protein